MIKYRFSKGDDGSVVDVSQLESDGRTARAPYLCFGCGRELIPHIGLKKVKHFSHKKADTCSRETYLHNLAKHSFFTSYQNHLRDGFPYIFTVRLPAVCKRYEGDIGLLCDTHKDQPVDLTKHFPTIGLEENYKGFVPDILLQSKDKKDVIFLEIAVTHECDQSKIDAGFRIIEIKIQDESQVIPILEGRLSEVTSNTRIFNFNKKTVKDDICRGDCKNKVLGFLVYKSQKSILLELAPSEASKRDFKGSVTHHEIIVPYNPEKDDARKIYKQKIRESFFKGVPVRNCYMCKYHGLDGIETAIFCKTKKQSVNSNEAVSCERYNPFRKVSECNLADLANEKYLKANSGKRLSFAIKKFLFGDIPK